MRAILSGQTGIAMLGDDDTVFAITIEAPGQRSPCSWVEAPFLFADADDVVELPDVSEDDALKALEHAWCCDRALRLTLILLDCEEDAETRRMATDCVEAHFADEEVEQHVANRLYSAVLPSSADLTGAELIAMGAGATRVGDLLHRVETDQTAIASVRQAWDEIPSEAFDVDVPRERVEAVLIDMGVFRLMVEALRSGMTDRVKMASIDDSRLDRLWRYHRVLGEWDKALHPMKRATGPLPKAETRRKRFAEVLDIPVAQLNLPVRTVNLLENDGIFLVLDLLNCTRDRLFAIPGFSERALEQVFQALHDVGLACNSQEGDRGRWSYVGDRSECFRRDEFLVASLTCSK